MVLLLTLVPALALAKANGIATTSCSGCHGGGNPAPTVSLTGPAQSITPGSTVTLTLTLGGGVANGGFHLTSYGSGTFIAGSGTRVHEGGISHAAPRSATGGNVTFTVQWTAPPGPGGAEFDVGVIGGNADGRSSGDRPGFARLSLAWGCTPTAYFSDLDRDGHGNPVDGQHLRCAAVPGLAALGDDCDDNDERVFPTAIEACNQRDDNCNQQIDEGLTSTTTWPDLDGDGFGNPSGTTQMGCATSKRAANNRDCDDTKATRFPGAAEVCNLEDDDCDTDVDEGVRVRCGTGWCARYGPNCDPQLCMIGEPRAEECNAFDDDCDGVPDNGQLCGANGVCYEGRCYADDAPLPVDAGAGGGSGAGGGGGTGSGTEPPGSGCQSAPWLSLLGVLAVLRRVRHEPMRRA